MGLELKLVSFLGVRERRVAREIPVKPGGLSFEPAARGLRQVLVLSLRIATGRSVASSYGGLGDQ